MSQSNLSESALTPAPDAQDLAQRRRQLKARRKFQFYKLTWRTLAMVALTAGTLRLATSPIWLIRGPQHIEVTNNQLLSDENIQALLPVPYPQSLLTVQPDDLEIALTQYEPIETAAVRRRLLPPGLHVQVSERQPVAMTVPNTGKPIQSIPSDPVPFEEPGIIDAEGYWMPRNSFAELGANASPPTLIVKGLKASHVDNWPSVYEEIARSPVTITTIDWSQENNLTLQSELGTVHLGPYSNQFDAQLAALDQLRQLGDQVNPEKVAFIDLQDPQNPIVEILQATGNSVANP
ncbi:MAG: FtsQ-type POTRA domain-containing protein [Cyanobacteria bacterium P01_F01_bin.3]